MENRGHAARDPAAAESQEPLHFGFAVKRMMPGVEQALLRRTRGRNPVGITAVEPVGEFQEFPCATPVFDRNNFNTRQR
jgi:hypothetical protein